MPLRAGRWQFNALVALLVADALLVVLGLMWLEHCPAVASTCLPSCQLAGTISCLLG